MGDLRLYDPDYYCEVTLRTNRGDFGFDLNDTDLRDQIYGVFAEAQERYAMDIFVFHFMSNHYHGLYGFESPAQLVAFFAFLHGNLARLAHRTNGTHGAFWAPLQVNAVATDAESVGRRIRYIMGQAVAAKLVDHPGQFPGPSSVDAMLYGKPLMGKRLNHTQRCRDAARLVGGAKPDDAYERWTELRLAVPRCWAELSPEERRPLYSGIADEIAGTAPRPGRAGQEGGECLIPEIAGDPDSVGQPAVDAPLKRPVPTRRADDGGRYRQGPVQPKQWDGKRKRSRPPRLLAADQWQVEGYDKRYSVSVVAYREAKQDWRDNSRTCDGSMRSAAISLPPWMLLGTLPLRLRGDRWAGSAKAMLPG